MATDKRSSIGWIGTGRMGYEMAARLAKGGADVLAWNRTRAKAEPLEKYGAKVADRAPRARRPRHRVLHGVHLGRRQAGDRRSRGSALRGGEAAHGDRVLVDLARGLGGAPRDARRARHRVPRRAGERQREGDQGGQALVRRARGRSRRTTRRGRCLDAMGQGSSYVGEGELARIVKICHNVLLGVVTQSLAEVTILAQKAGMTAPRVPRLLQPERDGLELHALQDAGVRQPRLQGDVHAAPAAQGHGPRTRRRPPLRGADAARVVDARPDPDR